MSPAGPGDSMLAERPGVSRELGISRCKSVGQFPGAVSGSIYWAPGQAVSPSTARESVVRESVGNNFVCPTGLCACFKKNAV